MVRETNGNVRWRAKVTTTDGLRLPLGYYSDEEEAARAYDRAARQFYGGSAEVNFPDGRRLCKDGQRRGKKRKIIGEC